VKKVATIGLGQKVRGADAELEAAEREAGGTAAGEMPDVAAAAGGSDDVSRG
jgi:hypothetical protein